VTHTSLILASRYRLESRIAVGGVGEVWRAADLLLDRPVAVKLLRAEYAQHPQTLARFRAEARHAASLTHPGIAQVYDYGEAGREESPYLVMELVDGPSLAGVLAAGPLDPRHAMDVLAQAAAGLQAAHEAGLVHRDVKPANLLVGPAGRIKITDFGIASAAGSAPITRAGTLVGTPAYLAPERAAGGPATPASDLYSLGVVGYECLTGTPPFSGMPVEVAAAHRQRPLPILPPAVPAGVAGLVAQLTAKDPAARPASAGEVAVRAGRLRDGLAVGTTAAGVAGEPGAPGGPASPAPATWVDAEPVTLAGWPAPDPAPAHRRPRRERARPGRGAVLAAAAAVVAGLAAWLLIGLSGAASPQRQPGDTHPARLVAVNASALAGQPVSAVSQRLRQLGLHPRIAWTADGGQEPGTVVSVQPSGQVPAGSIVTVTAALQPPGHRHDHGNGNGGDGGGGGGNGQGGGGD
jgi:serine/threonine-protein kinase